MRDNNLYVKNQNRYLRDRRMTLIIGFRCSQGVALVSDTKIVDLETGDEDFSSKILTPLKNTPFVVGAAGYSDLFRQFNREIPQIVDQRLNEFRISNIEALLKSGLSRDKAIQYLRQIETPQLEKTSQPVELEKKVKTKKRKREITPIPLPYVYSYQFFINDCKEVIRRISEQVRTEVANPLDVLIGLKGPYSYPSLHYIDCLGHEREIDKFYQIGSGSPHVRQFFEPLWDFDKDILELIGLAFYVIAYVRDVAKDKSVGFSDTKPPEAVVVYNEHNYGRIKFDNEFEFFLELETQMELVKKTIKKIHLPKLKVQHPKNIVINVPRLSDAR
jgi:20S proteasome alpha/beta subunit